jgi:hypothetical protein
MKKLEIYSCNTRTITPDELINKLVKRCFTINQYPTSSEGIKSSILHALKVKHKFGSFIAHYVAFIWEPAHLNMAELVRVLDGEVRRMIINAEKEDKVKTVRQRYVIYCLYGRNIEEQDIKIYLSNFSFLYSLILPVIIDYGKYMVYHPAIPTKYKLAKGKAISELQDSVSESFY